MIIYGNNAAGSFVMGAELAEPMQTALSGKSGTMVGLDYRGKKVLAAYEPVNVDDRLIGIVAKVDLYEIRAPFIRASFFTSLIGVFLIWA